MRSVITSSRTHYQPSPLDALQSHTRALLQLGLCFAACAGSVLIAALLVHSYIYAMVVPAAIVLPLLIVSPRARLLFVIFGGMAVLQTSSQLDLAKMAYFGGTFLCVGVAYVNNFKSKTDVSEKMEPLCQASVLTILILLLTAGISQANGTSLVSWLRDAAPYFLMASIPFLVVDASRASRIDRFALALFILLGLLASGSHFVEWAGNRRGLIDLPLGRLLLPTPTPAVALFFYATARTFFGKKLSVGWLILTLLLPIPHLLTGSRSALLLLLGPAFMLVMNQRQSHRASGRIVLIVVIAAIAIFTVLPSLVAKFDQQRLIYRLDTIQQLITDPSVDSSFDQRSAQTSASIDTFLSHPFMGVGLGTPIPWSTPMRSENSSFNLDTGLSFLAKFGMIGVFLLVAWMVKFKATWTRLSPSLRFNPALKYAFLAFLFQIGAGILLRNPFEDKGTAFSVLVFSILVVTAPTPDDEGN